MQEHANHEGGAGSYGSVRESLSQDNLPDTVLALTHPSGLIADPRLTPAEKRSVLAAWISDARAVEGRPALRQWYNGAIARIDDLSDALKALDDQDTSSRHLNFLQAPRPPEPRRRRLRPFWPPRADRRRDWSPDDDDDPPPCPVSTGGPNNRPVSGGQNAEVPPGWLQQLSTALP
jgi:hypothetical protein